MKKLKTLVVATLCFVLIFALCACQDPAGSGGGNGGNGSNAENAGNNGSNVELTEEQKIAHIDELISQQVTEEVWNKIFSSPDLSNFNASAKFISSGSENSYEASCKLVSNNGIYFVYTEPNPYLNLHLQVMYVTQENGKYYCYMSNEYNTWQKIEITDAEVAGVMDLAFPVYDFGQFTFEHADFTFDSNKKGYSVSVNGVEYLIKFENNHVVYLEQTSPYGEIAKLYYYDYGTTKTELPEEVKNALLYTRPQ